jgi:hypothetical protein
MSPTHKVKSNCWQKPNLGTQDRLDYDRVLLASLIAQHQPTEDELALCHKAAKRWRKKAPTALDVLGHDARAGLDSIMSMIAAVKESEEALTTKVRLASSTVETRQAIREVLGIRPDLTWKEIWLCVEALGITPCPDTTFRRHLTRVRRDMGLRVSMNPGGRTVEAA